MSRDMNKKKEWKTFFWFVLIPYYVISIIIVDKLQLTGLWTLVALLCAAVGGVCLIWISATLAAIFGPK